MLDPLAQNFFVDSKIYPNGIFLTSIRVCFFSKDKLIPVSLQVRPTLNGYPHSTVILPFSQVTLVPNQINITNSPNLDDPSSYTEFTFDSPLYLFTGSEYSFILMSNSNNYNIYSALVGEKVLGSDRIISTPPYIGALFKSQNSSTWSPIQGESLMFRMQKALFSSNVQGTLLFNNSGANSNTYVDTLYVGTSDQKLNNTDIKYAFKATSNADGSLSSYVNYIPNSNYDFNDRKVITSGNSFKLQSILSTTDPNVSPIIDTERMNILAIENIINNGSISNDNIVITNSGQGYNVANTNIIEITGGGGSGAVIALGNTDPITGNLTNFYVVSGGQGYTSSPNVTIRTVGYNPTYNVYSNGISVIGETNPSGGLALARYITKKITLADGMDAGDIKVFLDVHRPLNTDVEVYYKILSAEDPTRFEDQNYNLMTQTVGNNTYSKELDDFIEYTYQLDTSGTTDKKTLYSTFSSFKYFSIKIALFSNSPTNIPKIKNFRAIALPTV